MSSAPSTSDLRRRRAKYPPMNPERTLVFLDDHVSPLLRLAALRARGFRRFILDDNYPSGSGWSWGESLLSLRNILEANNTESSSSPEKRWLHDSLIEYSVFPPLFHLPSLLHNTSETTALKFGFQRHFSTKFGGCFPPPGVRPLRPAPALLDADREGDMAILSLLHQEMDLDFAKVQTDPDAYKELFSYCWITYLELK
ncbi:unnamed protein product [Amoebophrya sp. A25]|nr:unnamed protein product [Amoebophrya sp. A25]|eukprot:GSA25T00025208001.1